MTTRTPPVDDLKPTDDLAALRPAIPGLGLGIMAVAILAMGLFLNTLREDSGQLYAAANEPGCPLNIEGNNVRLAVNKSIVNRGRNITCRQFDGHPVLIYTTLNG